MFLAFLWTWQVDTSCRFRGVGRSYTMIHHLLRGKVQMYSQNESDLCILEGRWMVQGQGAFVAGGFRIGNLWINVGRFTSATTNTPRTNHLSFWWWPCSHGNGSLCLQNESGSTCASQQVRQFLSLQEIKAKKGWKWCTDAPDSWIELIWWHAFMIFHDLSCLCVLRGFASVPQVLERLRLELRLGLNRKVQKVA